MTEKVTEGSEGAGSVAKARRVCQGSFRKRECQCKGSDAAVALGARRLEQSSVGDGSHR